MVPIACPLVCFRVPLIFYFFFSVTFFCPCGHASNLDTVHGLAAAGEEESIGRGHHEAVSARAAQAVSVPKTLPNTDLSAHVSAIRFPQHSFGLLVPAREKPQQFFVWRARLPHVGSQSLAHEQN